MRSSLYPICMFAILLFSSQVAAQTVWDAVYQGNDGNDTVRRLLSSTTSGDLLLLESEGHNGNDIRTSKLSGSQPWSFIYDSGADDRPQDVIYSSNGCTVLFDVYNGTDWDVRVAAFLSNGSITWSDTFSSAADDFGAALIRNSSNDVYVASALHNGTDYDWLVVRYNLSGVAQSAQAVNWGADDIPVSMAADNAGNVYVAGTSDDGSGSGGVNVRVAKFNSSGSVAWSVPYDGGAGAEGVKDIVCDTTGNCYVLGTAETALGEDVLLVRVTGAGNVDWNKRFNGGVTGSNEPGGLALDPAGGCVLSGSVYNGTDFDWFTAMYDVAGTQGWRDDYATSGVEEKGMDVAVDSNSETSSVGIVGTGSGTALWTLYLNNSGSRSWTDNDAKPNLTGGFTGFSSSGAPRVASTCLNYGNTDGLVRSLNAGGSLNSAINVPGPTPVQINSTAIDASGNIYVAGTKGSGGAIPDQALLVKYDSSGNQLWARLFPANSTMRWTAMAISAAGKICLTGERFVTTQWAAITAQYSPAGSLDWYASYGSPYGRGVDLEIDAAGNIYTLVWGRSASSVGSGDHALVLTYDTNGTPGWTYEYSLARDNHPVDLFRDASGNLYIAGDTDTNSSAQGYINYLLIKLDSAGSEQWVRTPDFSGDDFAKAVTADASGNVYVTGTSNSSPAGATTTSYDSAGNFRWNDTQAQVDWTKDLDILVNGNGEICVAATFQVSGTGKDIGLIRYSAGGGVLGVVTKDVAGDDDIVVQMTRDSQSRIYVVGTVIVTGSAENIYIARFSSSGTFEWGLDYDSSIGFPDFGRTVVVDASDSPIVGGIYDFNPQKRWSLRRFSTGQSPTDIQLSNNAVNENTATGTVIGTITATDPTAGDTHTYSLVAGTGDADNSEFTIVGDELRVAMSHDYEVGNTRSIRVRATDSTSLYFEKVFQISISDVNEAPTTVTMTSTYVNENQPSGELVGQLNTTDPDAADSHTYSLVGGTGSADNSLFTINTRDLLTLTTLDFETTATLSIRVRSTDSGGLNIEQVFTINVQDTNDAPTGVALGTTSVPELQPVGTTVGTLSAVDADAADSHTFALVGGTGDSGNGSFVISGDQLQTAAVFNMSVQSSFSIRVRATDSASEFVEQILTIAVSPYDAPSDISLSGNSIDENMPSGTTVGTITATDPTAGDTHTFSLVSGVGDTDNSLFTISGSLLQSSGPFDFEARNSLSVRIRATDSTSLTFDKVFIITVNDLPEGSTDGGDGKEEDKGCPASTGASDGRRLFVLLLLCVAAFVGRSLIRQGDRRSSRQAPPA